MTENATTETVETVEVTDRPFLSTPIDDYTVTEGLLLVIAFLLIVGFVGRLIRGAF